MDPLLHSPDALTDIASEAAEPARSWARALLAVWYPDRRRAIPTADLLWDPILARRAPSVDELVAASQGGSLTEGLAATLCAALDWGHDLTAHAPVLRTAIATARPDAVPWLVHALPDPLTVDDVTASAAAEGGAAAWLAPAAVLRLIASRGGDPASTRQVLANVPSESVRFAILRALGLPPPNATTPSSIEEAVARGAERAGAPTPRAPHAKGSRHRRAAAWASTLLQGRPDALSLTLRACLTMENSPAMTRLLMEEASWIAHFEPSNDPVADVISRGATHHRPTMVTARSTATPADLHRLSPAAESGVLGAAMITAALGDDGHAAVWSASIARGTAGPDAPTWEALACATTPACAPRLPALLADPALRDLGLGLAAWCPTFDVLQALISMPVPHAPAPRRAWAWALACSGDRVAAEHLASLAQADPELDLSQPLGLATALGL